MTKKTTKTNSIKSKLKDGDIVLIKLVYEAEKRNNYGNINTYANFHTINNPHANNCYILEEDLEDSDIHSILESPLRVGDKVRIPHSELEWEIKALIDGKAWLWFNSTTCSNFIERLTKVS